MINKTSVFSIFWKFEQVIREIELNFDLPSSMHVWNL